MSAAESKHLCFLALIFAAVNADDVTTRFDSQLVSRPKLMMLKAYGSF